MTEDELMHMIYEAESGKTEKTGVVSIDDFLQILQKPT